MRVACDIECDSLTPKVIHCIVCIDIKTGKEYVFEKPLERPEEFIEFTKKVSHWVFHNGINFDIPVLCHFFCIQADAFTRCTDTLVVSRLLNYRIEGGHSLEAWGERLRFPKMDLPCFLTYTPEMKEYCINDVKLTIKLYKLFEKYIISDTWKRAIELEHTVARACQLLNATGFHFDVKEASRAIGRINRRLQGLDEELLTAFPPRVVRCKEVLPRATKFGTLNKQDFKWLEPDSNGNIDLSPYSCGCPFTRISFVPFNPGSPSQIVERLNEAGWKPFEKTKGHIQAERDKDEDKLTEYRKTGWKVSEANLMTLPETAPKAAWSLVHRLTLASRLSDLEEWMGLYNKDTERIHGTFNGIGSWTHRLSHTHPNTANIASPMRDPKTGETLKGEAGYYGYEMRSMWKAPPGKVLLGVDADAIQLRILAHYMDDPAFTEALVRGDKKKGTDAHTLNKLALGDVCKDRDTAKTFIYMWLLGGGVEMTMKVLSCTREQAIEARKNFLEAYPSLKKLKDFQIPKDAERGYFVGLDGRLVSCNTKHKVLAGYLQNGEKVVMSTALSIWLPSLQKEKIPFKFANWVHDEFVIELPDDPAIYLLAKAIVEDSIRLAGESLRTKCPHLGTGKVGYTWYDVH